MAVAAVKIPESELKKAVHLRQLVCFDVDKNNKKFWKGYVLPDGTYVTEFGIVDVTLSQSNPKSLGSIEAAKKQCDKDAKKKLNYSGDKAPYQEARVIEGTSGAAGKTTSTQVNKTQLTSLAVEQIQTNNQDVKELIKFLVVSNRHTILNNTTIQYDDTTGLFRTPLGVLTPDAISDARKLLNVLGDFVVRQDYDNQTFKNTLNQYLMTVPQNVGTKLNPKALFPDASALQKQNGILDSLAASVQQVMAPKPVDGKKATTVEQPKLFNLTLDRIDDGRVIDQMRRLYKDTAMDMHSCRHLNVKTVYRIAISVNQTAFDGDGAKVGGIVDAWHGTSVANLLSIFKGGLVVPPRSSPHVCGRAYGDGVYGAIHSTKSLNYAYGYWDGTRNERCFMFRMKMAMGKYYVPTSTGGHRPAGYDSIWAKGGQSGVINDELIVPRASQVRLEHLLEFTPQGK